MNIKKKILILMIFISVFLMGSALAIYLASMDVQSKGTILAADEEKYDFEVDYDIVGPELTGSMFQYVINISLIYNGENPLYFWDLQFNIPEEIASFEALDADAFIDGTIMKVTNISDFSPIFNGETINFTITILINEEEYYPTGFTSDNFIVKEKPQPKLDAQLELVSALDNTYKYYITIKNKGNVTANNWRLSLAIHESFLLKGLSENANYIQQPTILLLSGIGDHPLIQGESLSIDLEYITEDKSWDFSIIDLTITEADYE